MAFTPTQPLRTTALREALHALGAPVHVDAHAISFALFHPGTLAAAQYVFVRPTDYYLKHEDDEGFIVRGAGACHATLGLFELRVRQGGPFVGFTMTSLLRPFRPPHIMQPLPTPITPAAAPHPDTLRYLLCALDGLPACGTQHIPCLREAALSALVDCSQSVASRTCAAHLLWTHRDMWLSVGPDVHYCLYALWLLPDRVKSWFAVDLLQRLIRRSIARAAVTCGWAPAVLTA